jgi:fibronectin-binding autotransporter adhesin
MNTNPLNRLSSDFLALTVAFSFVALTANPAIAGNGTWAASPASANWEAGNWGIGSAFPGTTGTTSNGDTAFFTTSSTTSILINAAASNSSALNINKINFGPSGGGAATMNSFTIGTTGGNGLLLTSGGSITFAANTSSGSNLTETINAPIVIGTGSAAQTYNFTNSNATSSNILVFGGAISGGTSGTTTLSLGGANAGANAINGIISNGSAGGTVALAAGAGAWTLSKVNTYTGGTTISGTSTLTAANTSALGSLAGGATLALSGGTLDIATNSSISAYNTTVSGTATIASDLATSGAGITQTLGTLSIGANTLNITKGANVTSGSPVVAFGTATLSATTGTTTLNPTTAALTLTSVTGSAGTSNIDTLALGGTRALAGNAITGIIGDGAGGGVVAVNTSGAWTLSGANSYTGGTTIAGVGSALSISADNNLGTAPVSATSNNLVIGVGTLATTATFTLNSNRGIGLGSTGSSSQNGNINVASGTTLTYNGVLANAGSGVDTLTATGAGTLLLGGANTYTGKTTISSGTLDFSKTTSLYNATTGSWTAANLVVQSGGTIAFGVGSSSPYFTTTNVSTLLTNLDHSVTTGGLLAGSSIGFDTTNAGGSFTVATTIADTTGTGGGAVGVAKLGTGSLILTAANTYTGGTAITAGNLYAQNGSSGSATGAGPVNVSGSGLLGVTNKTGSNKGSVSGTVTLTSGGTFYSGGVATGTPATGATTGAALTSALNVNGGNLTFALSAGGVAGTTAPNTTTSYLTTTGTVNFGSGYSDTITLVDLTNGGLTLRQNSAYLLIQAGATPLTLTDDELYTGLVIVAADGTRYVSGAGVDENGYVLGVSIGGSTTSYTAITFTELGSDGVTPLTNVATYGKDVSYLTPTLYLYNGDLEVVPEPGTWALILGGLALLVVIQRTRKKNIL